MRVIILHGTQGDPSSNWFPWLADKVRKAGNRVLIPRLPTPEGQSLAAWQEAFQSQAGQLTNDTILVGHSIGATFALHLLENSTRPIKGTLLVSGLIEEINNPVYDELNQTFIRHSFDWQKIKDNAGDIHIYHGDDDPYVPIRQATFIARDLNIELTAIPGGGHLNAESRYTKFQRLWDDLKPLLDRA